MPDAIAGRAKGKAGTAFKGTDWSKQLDQLVKASPAADFARANAKAVVRAVEGRGPDDGAQDPRAGARMVVNISSAHVPGFCAASRDGQPRAYKNAYDLQKYRLGDSCPPDHFPTRVKVDSALPLEAPLTAKDVYFGALELNGTGIRFYGDVCLVLGRDTVDGDTVILDRNSYDLVRSPLREIVDAAPDPDLRRREEAWKLRGLWSRDLGSMASHRVLSALGVRARRCTTGQICEALRDDEDYIEVLKPGSFSARDLQEARISAPEAGRDAFTADRLASGPAPRMEVLLWRERRRKAEEELRLTGVPVTVVTTLGRLKD